MNSIEGGARKQIDYFVPDRTVEARGVLARYCQPLSAEVVATYIEAYTEAEEIVLNPFCRDGTVVREAIKAGRRAIAVDFNPVAILAVRAPLRLPPVRELDAALTRLGDTRKVGEPIRAHLNRLYATPCPRCRRAVVADYFIWDRGQDRPVERSYRCPACGAEGLAPVETDDLDHLAEMEGQGFHYWYILDRLAPAADAARETAQRLLDLYTPRNLYALANLLIKIETLFADSPLEEALKWALLECLDTCSSFNPAPIGEARPRRLRLPSRFIERNVWQAFEEACETLREWPSPAALRLCEQPEEVLSSDSASPQAAIAVCSVHRLVKRLPAQSVALILTAPPRPDATFWSLSFLWSGWLFGREAAAPLKSLLRLRSSDWDWYLKAMASAFKALRHLLTPDGRLALIFTAKKRLQVKALLLALSSAGFALEEALYQPIEAEHPREAPPQVGRYRLSFAEKALTPATPSFENIPSLACEIQRQAQSASLGVLQQRGEPLAENVLRHAIYRHLSQRGLLEQVMVSSLGEDISPLDFVTKEVAAVLKAETTENLIRLEGGTTEEEKREDWGESLWWLREPQEAERPLSDRVEEGVRDILRHSLVLSEESLAVEVYACFPALLTPEAGLIQACLASYGQELTPGYWQLRAEDQEGKRLIQRRQGVADLAELGERLGYEVRLGKAWSRGEAEISEGERDLSSLTGFDILWLEGGTVTHVFVALETAALGDIVAVFPERGPWMRGLQRYLVVPAERGQLLEFKLARYLWLRDALVRGDWQFIKYPHLGTILQVKELDRHDLKKIVGLSPIIEQDEAQMPLF